MPDHITPEQHVAALSMPFRPSRRHAIPDVLYAVSARVTRTDAHGYSRAVSLPTFYLDSRVQGIRDERHAELIVRRMIADLGHAEDAVSVQVSATLGPCEGRC